MRFNFEIISISRVLKARIAVLGGSLPEGSVTAGLMKKWATLLFELAAPVTVCRGPHALALTVARLTLVPWDALRPE
jgi:hypothetical protein